MNKAFVRELDREEPRCPAPRGCGGEGVVVAQATVRAILGRSSAASCSDSLRYCANPACEVVYYEPWSGEVIGVEELAVPVWPKVGSALLCPCFGIREQDLREDARAGRKDRIRALLEHADSTDAHCLDCTGSGRSCVADARKVFLKEYEQHRSEG